MYRIFEGRGRRGLAARDASPLGKFGLVRNRAAYPPRAVLDECAAFVLRPGGVRAIIFRVIPNSCGKPCVVAVRKPYFRGLSPLAKKMLNPATLFDPKLEPKCPLTLDAAVERLLPTLAAKDKAIVAAMPESGLADLNRHEFGAAIRKDFALWRGNKALMASCGALNPEDASLAIIRAVWERLRG